MRTRAWIGASGGALLFATSAGLLPAQAIRVEGPVRVARGLERQPLVEPHLTAHPTDRRQLLGAAIVADAAREGGPSQTCAAFHSADGGRTWAVHRFPVPGCYDPWVAVAPGGRAVFAALERASRLVVFHSPDGGRTWASSPARLGGGHDHPTLAASRHSAARRGGVYVVSTQPVRADTGVPRWSVFVARSRDGGRVFDPPARVVPSNLNLNAEQAAVLSEGALVASFVDTQRRPPGGFGGEDEDAGTLERRRAWVLRSADGGRTFSPPLLVTEVCAMGWTALAADLSPGPFRDRLYFACRQRGGGAVMLTHSADGGETWADPMSVHATPADTVGGRHTPALAVSGRGVVGVAWLDGRGIAGDVPARGCPAVYFTASLDGGRTFLPEQPVSGARACPDSAANGVAYSRWPAGGDYFGLAAAADGRFHLLWADGRGGGPFQLWTAAVRVDGPAAAGR